MKMERADFNKIFVSAWSRWQRQQELERAVGTNSITTAWRGTGLFPYNRKSLYWEAAIAKFGKREELAGASANGEEAMQDCATPDAPGARTDALTVPTCSLPVGAGGQHEADGGAHSG